MIPGPESVASTDDFRDDGDFSESDGDGEDGGYLNSAQVVRKLMRPRVEEWEKEEYLK